MASNIQTYVSDLGVDQNNCNFASNPDLFLYFFLLIIFGIFFEKHDHTCLIKRVCLPYKQGFWPSLKLKSPDS